MRANSPLNGLSQPANCGRKSSDAAEDRAMIEASRTLMKSEPELAELVAAVEGVEVTMAEKGFGTLVELRVEDDSGLREADLERILDRLAEPQKQPFA
jgi:transcription elongation GreA/GreB family factor